MHTLKKHAEWSALKTGENDETQLNVKTHSQHNSPHLLLVII